MSHARIATLAAFGLLAVAAPAEAHVFGAHGAGLGEGLAHPFGGLDHLLAMLAVGVWAARSGGRAPWAVPLAFVAMMALGFVGGAAGLALPLVETGILTSLVVLGGLVALGGKLPLPAAMAVVGAFAIFHGHAHGTEMPAAAASTLAYGLGFLAATATLHLVGVGAALMLARPAGTRLLRAGGAATAAVGALLLVA